MGATANSCSCFVAAGELGNEVSRCQPSTSARTTERVGQSSGAIDQQYSVSARVVVFSAARLSVRHHSGQCQVASFTTDRTVPVGPGRNKWVCSFRGAGNRNMD